MKFTIITLFVFLFHCTLFGQNWNTNFKEASIQAKEENKNIILVFSGSDWCAPCMKLDKNLFKTKEFIDYSNKNWVLLKADFPRKKKNALSKEQTILNGALAEKYNQSGFFPLIVILNAEGKELGKTGYEKYTPNEYIEHLSSF